MFHTVLCYFYYEKGQRHDKVFVAMQQGTVAASQSGLMWRSLNTRFRKCWQHSLLLCPRKLRALALWRLWGYVLKFEIRRTWVIDVTKIIDNIWVVEADDYLLGRYLLSFLFLSYHGLYLLQNDSRSNRTRFNNRQLVKILHSYR